MIRQTIKIFLITFSTLYTQQISKITIAGNTVFPSAKYEQVISVGAGNNFTPGIIDSINNRISFFLFSEGYYNHLVKIDTAGDLKNTTFQINLAEGTPTLVRKITQSTLSRNDSLLFIKTFSGLEGQIHSASNISFYSSQLISTFENTGFPFASVQITNQQFDFDGNTHQVSFDVIVDKGPLSKFDKIIVEGNERTSATIIERELRLSHSEIYNQEKLNDIPYKLNKLGFFRPLEPPDFFLDNQGKGVLRIKVDEINTNNFDGIIGYVPGTQSESGFFTGFVNINMRNLFGTGRAILIKWEQENRESQELELNYLEPWFLDYPINISVGLYQRKQDSTFVQRNINSDISYLINNDISASVIFNSESTIPTENALVTNNVFNSTLFTSGASIKIDTRDDIFAPTKGIKFNNTYKYVSKSIDASSLANPNIPLENTLQKFEIDFESYFSLWTSHILSLGLHGREMKGSLFEFSDLYSLGGTKSLRGYKEKQFRGNRIFWSNLEYRLHFDQRSFMFAFIDSGYFLRREEPLLDIIKQEAFKIGYGFGLSLETAIGILKVSYALGEGDSMSNGKIHFGIANEF